MTDHQSIYNRYENYLHDLEKERPFLSKQHTMNVAHSNMVELWPVVKELLDKYASLYALYQCFEAIYEECKRGIYGPGPSKPRPEDLANQLKNLPADRIVSLLGQLKEAE